MKYTKRNYLNRVLAMLLVVMLMVGMVPMNTLEILAAENPGVLTTDIGEKDFHVGEATEFTFTTTANDDAGVMVLGSFSFSDPSAIERLEYKEARDGQWYELNGDFGPAGGFPMMDMTSEFRVTFNKAGNYTVTAGIKKAEDGSVVCSTTNSIIVAKTTSVLTTDIGEKTFYAGEPTEFTFTTTANDDAGVMVLGSFVFSDMSAIEKLEYKETQDGQWYELNGDFGPAGGFPMMDITSEFRVTFNKPGTYTVDALMKRADNGEALCSISTTPITVSAKYKVSVADYDTDEGTVTLTPNGDSEEAENGFIVDKDTQVVLAVTAKDGYQIETVEINHNPQTLNDKKKFSSNLIVGENMEITVTFVKVYTVTVTHGGNGAITKPEGMKPEGGTITVKDGNDIEIQAIPNEGYRVSGVTINGESDTAVNGENDSSYTKILEKIERDYTIEITFALNNYTVSVNAGENGSASAEKEMVPHGESTTVNIQPDEGYTVDAVLVNDEPIEIIYQNNGSYSFTIGNITENQTVEVTFVEPSKAGSAAVTFNREDKVDALRADSENNIYVYKEGGKFYFTPAEVTEEGAVVIEDIRLYDTKGEQIGTTAAGAIEAAVEITDEQSIGSIELYYHAKGELCKEWHKVEGISNKKPLKIVVDKKKVTVEMMPNDANENDYYNADVSLTVKVVDEEDYSGIAKVEYAIITKDEVLETDWKELYSYQEGDEIKDTFIIDENKPLVVSANTYNYKYVYVFLRATDRAGNETTTEKELHINATRPVITAAIDGTKEENAKDGYYNSERLLNITIEDRADTFDADKICLKISKNGGASTTITEGIVWEPTDDANKHIFTYKFMEDAEYKWQLSYTNKAGLSNEGIKESGESVYEFTIDKKAPHDLSIQYSESFADITLENITFGFFNSEKPAKVTISALDDTSGIESFTYSYMVEAGASSVNVGKEDVVISQNDITQEIVNGEKPNKFSASFEIPKEFRGKVSFTATDKAGHSAFLEDSKTIVVDEVAPGVTVTYDNNDFNEAGSKKYYNAERTATIEINEANFFGTEEWNKADLVELLKVTVEKTTNEGTNTDTLKPEFKQKVVNGAAIEDVYVASIPFEEEAEYQLNIQYTDRSGNAYAGYEELFVIDKTAPKISVNQAEGSYFNADRTAVITVEEHKFRAEDFVFTAAAVDVTEKTVDLSGKNYAEYLKNSDNWKAVEGKADTWEAEITFDIEGNYTIGATYTDPAGNPQEAAIENTFCVDKTNPENLEITYAPTSEDTVLEKLLEKITFGFYQAPVKVTVSATDNTAGIESFTYSYKVEEGASSVNAGKEDVVISSNNITQEIVNGEKTNKFSASFEIPEQFRGKVSFTAKDKAGNSASLEDSKTIVVDEVAPGVTVTYDNNDFNEVEGKKYYKANRTATIEINEANFFGTKEWGFADLEELLKITVEKTTNEGTNTDTLKPEFKQKVVNGAAVEDVYVASIPFEEDADYVFNIAYTDRSGNKYEGYAEEFTVDKTAPKISVNQAEGSYFNADRTAVITVEEHKFRAEDFVFTAAAVDVTEKTVDLSGKNYAEYLKNSDNWKAVEGKADTWEAEITFDIEGNYTIGATYTDPAGNPQEAAIENTFCVDKTNPENLEITYAPTSEDTVLEKLLEKITFGFYQAPVKVTVSATDNTAGIESFTYSYKVEEGASSVNAGKEDVVISSNNITQEIVNGEKTNKFSASFEIPEQFRGKVSFTAKDKAGNSASLEDSKTIVVDEVAPGVTVTYDNNDFNEVEGKKYYKANRTATIEINEANFFGTKEWGFADLEELLKITVEKTTNEGTNTDTLKPEFKQKVVNGAAVEDVYVASIPFEEDADYVFNIAYTDRSGNKYEGYAEEFTVDKTAPKISVNQAEGSYFNADRTAVVTVEEHKFRAEDFVFTAAAVDVTEKTVDLSGKNYAEYLKNSDNWKAVEGKADTWEAEITFDIEGNYTIGATYTDPAGNPQEAAIENTFCVDKTNPEDLKITYEAEFIEIILEQITFGFFYQAPVKVTVSATDNTAGIESFTYSYKVEEGASSVNAGKEDVVISSNNITQEKVNGEKTNKFSAFFDVPAQFRGKVSFTATDKAGHSAFLEDSKTIVVDEVAPGVTVTYDNNDFNEVEGKKYYNAERTATIEINEANFFGTEEWNKADLVDELLKITVEKTTNEEKTAAYVPDFVFIQKEENGAAVEDVYVASIPFEEDADYVFNIAYTDRSGNKYEGYTEKFTVDKTAPTIQVTYDNNSCNNGNQFKADRTATIIITEHNFNAKNIETSILASGVERNADIERLKEDKSWTKQGDVYTATLPFTEEAHWKFDISYSDEAKNPNTKVDYGKSIAPNEFTLDKTAPTEMDITIDGASVKGSMETLAFDKFYANAVRVELSANCDISGMQSLKYQKVANVSEYKENGTWTAYNETSGIVVVPSEKFIIYFRAEDRAGNVSIIRSTGIVVDNKMPEGEVHAPEIDILPSSPNANGFHKSDVTVDLKVVEPKYTGENVDEKGYYSGLNKITYRIYATDINAEKTGTLLDLKSGITAGAVSDEDALINAWSGSITVDSQTFNSNNVFVEIKATDNAGNERTSTTKAGEIQIDITAPTISVSYSNNNADSENIFKEDRVATIAVTERNFRPGDVQLTIKNTDGFIPALSEWHREAGTDMDDTKWIATITYDVDGDYEFGIDYTDIAGNRCAGVQYGNSVTPNMFTIDKTIPEIDVTYDNNSAMNENYYKEARTATIIVTEHNFNADRVNISLTATDDGVASKLPTVGAWATDGDKHIAKIFYENDSKYTFDISLMDKAGNEASDFAEQTFYVDKTAPTLTITGVANQSANRGDVIPVITYSDTNYDANAVTITLSGANRKNVPLDGSYTAQHNGSIFTFKNFAKTKTIDDIYTLTATLTDKAGNETTETLLFSVNRFGSTYALSETVEKMNGSYVQTPEDVVITEVNANMLKNIKITLFKNNETLILKEGQDYKIEVTGGNGEWYQYVYTIFKENFADDGVYRLSVYSEDIAGNVAENTLDTKNKELSFGVDKTKPNIVVANLESGITYALDSLKVLLSASDNLFLHTVMVYLDDYSNAYKIWTAEELAEIVASNGEFTFDIPGNSTSAHKVKIVCVDAAGNEQIEEITDFFVTTNIWVRYYNNKPLFFGSIAGALILISMIVFLVVYKKRKNEKE